MIHPTKYVSAASLVFTALLTSSVCLAQLASYEGVYQCSDLSLTLILRVQSNRVDGYITDGQNADKLTCNFQDEVLVLTSVQHPERGNNYTALDGLSNLWVTDDQLNMYYFTRTTDSARGLYEQIEKASKAAANTTASGANSSQNKTAANSSSYANKKFLHLYTGNGYTEKWAYYLYDTGEFAYRSGSSYTSGGYYDFSAALSGSDAGKYSIVKQGSQEVLVLKWNDGNETSFAITKKQDGYYLGNVKYFLVGLNEYE